MPGVGYGEEFGNGDVIAEREPGPWGGALRGGSIAGASFHPPGSRLKAGGGGGGAPLLTGGGGALVIGAGGGGTMEDIDSGGGGGGG